MRAQTAFGPSRPRRERGGGLAWHVDGLAWHVVSRAGRGGRFSSLTRAAAPAFVRVLLFSQILFANSAAAQEREIEIGPSGALVYEAPDPSAPVIKEAAPGMRARVLSRHAGYYKVRVGSRGQVGWVKVEETVTPKAPAPASPQQASSAAPPSGAPAAAPSDGGTAGSVAAAPAPKPGRIRGKPGRSKGRDFKVVEAGAVGAGGPHAEDDTSGSAEAGHASRAPAPLVPKLRLAWPPPFAEWLTDIRSWAALATPGHLAAVGVLAALIALLLLYAVFRFLRFLLGIPVRAVQSVVRRIRRALATRKQAPPKERPEVQRRLDEVRGLAAAVKAAGAAEISLHEVFVAAGADDTALSALQSTAAAQESVEGFRGWVDFLTGDEGLALSAFLRAYLLEVIWSRSLTFLDLHPLFGGRGVRAERQEGDQESDIAFQFVTADGLGLDLDEEQRKIALFLTTAIERARVHLPNPYGVSHFARLLASQAAGGAEGDTGRGDAGRGEAGRAETGRSDTAAGLAGRERRDTPDDGGGNVPPLSVLLFGASPIQHAGQFAAGRQIPREVGEALVLHMRAGTEVRYGPAHHAARSGVEPLVGVALVGALSGAMGTAAATLKARQMLASRESAALARACAALGAEVAGWIKERDGRHRAALRVAVERMLGLPHLDAAAKQVESLLPLHGRDLEAEARRRLGSWQPVTLPQALLHVHASEVTATREAVLAAAQRYLGFLEDLTQRPDDRVGLAAPGFLVAGLGPSAFADAPGPVKVAIAQAARAIVRTRASMPGAEAR